MIEFIQDDDRLRDERKKAKKNKDKYVGFDSDRVGSRSNFSSFSSGNNNFSSISSSSTRPTSDFYDNSISNKINDLSSRVKNMMDGGGPQSTTHNNDDLSDFSDGGGGGGVGGGGIDDFKPRRESGSNRERSVSGLSGSGSDNKPKPVNRIDPIKLKSTQIKKKEGTGVQLGSSSTTVRSKTMDNFTDVTKKVNRYSHLFTPLVELLTF